MPDRLTAGNRAPLPFLENFDCVKLNPLSTVQPFHRQCMVERDRMIEPNFENSMVRTGGRRPKSVRIAVEREFLFRSRFQMLHDEIRAISRANRLAKFLEPLNISIRN